MAANLQDYAGKVTVADGAWGTQLDQRGCPPGYCREEWNVSRPDVVREVAAEYVAAGAQIILTNTFCGNRVSLAKHGFDGRADEFNEAGARLSKEAAGESVQVFASMGPTGKILMVDEISEDEVYEAFAEQSRALARGGADAIVVETMTELAEIVAAVRAVRENTDLGVVASMTFDSGPEQTDTMMGVSPRQAVEGLTAAGAGMIGCNCGVGIENYIKVARLLRETTDLPIWVKANAGLPELIEGRLVYKESPQEYAAKIPQLIEAGANVIGGCCGTTPEHIQHIVELVRKRRM